MSAEIEVGMNVLVGSLRVTGTVVGIDTSPGHPGLEVRLHREVNGLDTCYASHSECTVVTRATDPTWRTA